MVKIIDLDDSEFKNNSERWKSKDEEDVRIRRIIYFISRVLLKYAQDRSMILKILCPNKSKRTLSLNIQ